MILHTGQDLKDVLENFTPAFLKKNQWRYGYDDWKWTADAGLYARWDDVVSPPSYYCLGDRLIHCDYGKDSYGILWRGSTCENWHGFHFGYNLKGAIEWTQQAAFSELGPYLWSKDLL